MRSCASTGRLRCQDFCSDSDGHQPVVDRTWSATISANFRSMGELTSPAAETLNAVTYSPRQHEELVRVGACPRS